MSHEGLFCTPKVKAVEKAAAEAQKRAEAAKAEIAAQVTCPRITGVLLVQITL